MASGGGAEDAPADDWGLPLDIDDVHMLLQVEQEQIQKRTFTNWINAQLSKRSPPSAVSDLFSDLRDGARLLDLLEVMSGQPLKRERGHGVFQQRGNIESALNFLKRKSVKLVNINIPDILDGRPSIILGLIWTIILHCHIEELASTLSFSSRHSSLDSLASLDSRSNSPAIGSPSPTSPTPRGRVSPLHARFRVSAKKALLMWVRDQCQRAYCPLSVKDFKSSWRSGVAFLAILCSLRPELVDLAQAQSRSNLQNLEEAFRLAEQHLHIPRLLEPEDVDVENPDDKSIMTYVAQFLQYSNDCPAPDDEAQASPNQRAREVTSWLQQAYQELLELWAATEKASYADRHQAFQGFVSSFSEQRRPVVPLLGAMRRCPEPSQDQRALRAAWDRLEDKLRQYKAELDTYLPAPLDSLGVWLQRVEAVLTEEGGAAHDHALAAKEARAKQDKLKTSIQEMSHHLNTLHMFRNVDPESGSVIVPLEKMEEIKRRFTNARVTAKYHGIKLEYQEGRHTVLDLLQKINAKLRSWKGAYTSHEAVQQLLQDWHETVDRQRMVCHLTDALLKMQQIATAYTSKASLGEDSQLVCRQVKEAESETASTAEAVASVRGSMERVLAAWEAYSRRLPSLQAWLAEQAQAPPPPAGAEVQGRSLCLSEWSGRQAQLNEVGSFLMEVTDRPTSQAIAEQLSRINMQWADYVKRTMFEACSQPCVGLRSAQAVQALVQEAGWLLREPLEVASGPLKAYRKRLQPLSKKIMEVDLPSLGPSAECPEGAVEELRHTLPELWQTLAKAERTCAELQRASSMLEGRVAELVHWGTEASESYRQLRERERRGHPSLEPRAKVLISRGLQLEGQVVTEAQDLQNKVAWAQRSSPLQHLSGVSIQDRVTEAVAQSQEMVEMLSSLGSRTAVESVTDQPPAEGVAWSPTQTEPRNGVPGVGDVISAKPNQSGPSSQAIPPAQPSSTKSPPGTLTGPQRPTPDSTFGTDTTAQNATVTTPTEPQAQRHPAQTQAEPTTHLSHLPSEKPPPLSDSLQQTLPQNKLLPQTTTGPNPQIQTSSPTLPKIRLNPFMMTSKTISTSQAQPQAETPPKHRVRPKTSSPQAGNQVAPHPPVMVSSEVHSKAQAMAKSRLEKAKFVLQEHIQQAVILFSDREISEWQAKRKQRALGNLRPAVLEEFLGAVEGLGAFCSGVQLRDLQLLSGSVRSQWEDVRSQMAAFLPLLWSEIRGGPPLNPVIMGCEMHANSDDRHHGNVSNQQACLPTEGEERVEALRGLWETLAPGGGPRAATAQRREAGGRLQSGPQPQEQHPGTGTLALPQDSRRQEQGGQAPLRKPGPQADPQQSIQDHPQPQSRGVIQTQPRLELPLQVGSSQAQRRSLKDSRPKALEPSSPAKDGPVMVQSHLVLSQTCRQGGPAHLQAVVRGDTVQSQQAAERAVIQPPPPLQEEGLSDQEVLERYQTSRLAFQAQLQKNRQHLEAEYLPETVTVPVLRRIIRDLQALKQDTEVLWFEFELQHSQCVQFFRSPRGLEEWGAAEHDKSPLTQQWRGQQICLQTRMASLDTTVDLMESADSQITLISDQLDRITSKPVDICNFTFTDPSTVADIEEIDQRIQSALRSVSGQSSAEEGEGPKPTTPPPLCHALRNCGYRLNQLRQRLKRVQSAAGALQRLLTPLGEADSGISLLQVPSDSQDQGVGGGVWVQEACASLAAAQQKVLKAGHEARGVDSLLKAAGMTLTKDGVVVTCQEVVASVSQRLEKANGDMVAREQGQGAHREPGIQKGGPHQQRQEHGNQRRKGPELEDEPKAQRRRHQGEAGESNAPRKKEPEKREGDEKKPPVQRRMALVRMLREVQAAVDQQALKEPTLPAVQHRMRSLTDLERRLDTQHSELRALRAAYTDSAHPGAAMEELESLWVETRQGVADRLEECRGLAELLKSFQSVRSVVSGALQRAERTISQQASYMGKDNLQRLLIKVDAAKDELSGLGDGVEEIRSVCRQLQAQLRNITDCADAAFETEADTLMDRWLDVTERTDSHLDSLRVGLALWEGLVQLDGEVESWTNNKMAAFAQSHPFQSDEEVAAFQVELQAQEESLERFHRRVSEIQVLLQSEEPPLELQVIETQTRKKMEQVKEFFSETLDIYRQLVAAKQQVSAKMAECQSSVQMIQNSLDNLCASDASELYAQIQELSSQLQMQAQQADSLMEELALMASVSSPENLQDLAARCVQLQDSVSAARRLVALKCEQAEEDIQRVESLQKECERLETWLKAEGLKAEQAQDVTSLPNEVQQNSKRTEALSELVRLLHGSTLKDSPLLQQSSRLLEDVHSLQSNRLLSEQMSQCERQQLDDETFSLQVAVQGLSERLAHQADISDEVFDISQFEHRWRSLQDCEQSLIQLAERVHDLQTTDGSNVKDEKLSSNRILAVDALDKNLDSLRISVRDKQQQAAADTAHRIRETASQLQSWCQTAQSQPQLPPQVRLDEGLQLHQDLQGALSQADFLRSCLGKKRAKKLEKSAAETVRLSAALIKSLSETSGGDSAEIPLRDHGVCQPGLFKTDMNEQSKSHVPDIIQPVETQQDMAEPRKISTIVLDTRLDYVDSGLREDVGTVRHVPEKGPATSGFVGMDGRVDGHSEAATHLSSVCVKPDTQVAGDSDTYTKPSDLQSETEPQCQKETSGTKKVFTIVLDIDQPQSEFQRGHHQLPSGGSGSTQCTSRDSLSFNVQGHSSVPEAAEGETEKPTQLSRKEGNCTESQGMEGKGKQQSVESELWQPLMTELKCPAWKGPRLTEDQPTDSQIKDPRSASLREFASSDIESMQQEEEGGRTEGSTLAPAQPSSACAGTEEAGGGAVRLDSPRHVSAMQGILSEIQGLVDRSDITKGGHQMEPTWYLAPSSREAEARLSRTVLRTLGCRYQPAQLNPTAMTQQLKEAESYRRSVLDQVAVLSSVRTEPCHAEGQCSAALLDASATLQVKEAQLNLITLYHKQMGLVGERLTSLASELAELTLEALGSNALQVDKLSSLLLTMQQQKAGLGKVLQVCGQVSVHLSQSEGSGTLLALLGQLQEQRKLMEATCTRNLWHSLVSSSQADDLLREAERLRIALQTASRSCQTQQGSPGAFEKILAFADLNVFNQQYAQLLCVSEELGEFGLGQKEREEMNQAFQGLKQLLDLTQTKLNAPSSETVSDSPSKILQQIQDRVVWAKRTWNLFTLGKRLALFPEEARVQIAGMRKRQMEIVFAQSKVQSDIGDVNALDSNVGEEEVLSWLKSLEKLYADAAEDCACMLEELEESLQGRERLFAQITKMDTWLVASHIEKETSTDMSPMSIPDLERKVQSHQFALKDVERRISFTDTLLEQTKEMAPGLTPAESHYLVNRLTGLRLELDGVLVHEWATIWELEELLHAQLSSAKELATVQASLGQIAIDLGKQSFPVTRTSLRAIEPSRRLLLEHLCHVQELQHCQKAQKGALLCTIAELQEKIRLFDAHAPEHEKYLRLRKRAEDSKDKVKGQIQLSKDTSVDVEERFRLCQTLLVELPLVKKECQEAADQLEVISQDLYPSQLTSERQKIRQTVENIFSCELTITNDIKMLEGNLLEGLHFGSEYKATMDFLHQSWQKLKDAGPVAPDESMIDLELQGCWVTWRNLESGMRVLEGLGQREHVDMRTCDKLFTLRETSMQECRTRMENLSRAREALKDYHWAAQGAVAFLHNAEATFLAPSGGFLDCIEELAHTQQALASFQEGIQAHVSHLLDVVPQQVCRVLAFPQMEMLHARVLSHVLVGRATLEAQAQLKLEALKRCADRQQQHVRCHGEVQQLLTTSEHRLSECAALDVTSLSTCVQQLKRAEALAEQVRGLAERLKELEAGCPAQGCSAGTEGALGALWRRWSLLQHRVSLLQAHAEQKKEEWKDIGISIEQCSRTLSRLNTILPDTLTVSSSPGDPQDLLVQAEEHQAELEEAQRALASLEHRLALLLGVSIPQEASIRVPVCQALVKMQESCRSLTENSMLLCQSAQSEVPEKQRWQRKISDVQQQMGTLPSILDTLPSGRQQQEGRLTLASQKLQSIMEGVRATYTEVPVEISNQIQEVTCTLQEMEQKFALTLQRSNSLQRLTHKIGEVGVGLEGIQTLLRQRSSTFPEAENTLKRVWDELDAWHGQLSTLEVEVQDLSEEQPEQAHLLMDQLTQPLQLYQDTAQQAEQRTAFLSKVPACFQEYEDILHSASCWLEEAQSWLGSTCTYTTAKNLQSHANTLQMVLDDSERIRATLDGFRPSLQDISAVCDTDALEERLAQTDLRVEAMQRRVIQPLDQLLHVTAEMESIEAELKAMEKNVNKIRAILLSADSPGVSLEEHLRNRKVILANIQSMRRTVEEMESCKTKLGLPPGAEGTLTAFPRAMQLLQPLQELEQVTRRQTALLESQSEEDKRAEEFHFEDAYVTTESSVRTEDMQVDKAERGVAGSQDAFGPCAFEDEDEEEEEESLELSSSDTLTSSFPEDPDETFKEPEQPETTTIQSHLDYHVQEPQPPPVTNKSESSEADFKGVQGNSSDSPAFCQVTAGPLQSNTLASSMMSELALRSTTSEANRPESVTTETVFIARPALEMTESVTTETQSVPQTGLATRSAVQATRDTVTQLVRTHAPAYREEAHVIPARPNTPFRPRLQHEGECHDTARPGHLGSQSEQGDVDSMMETPSCLAEDHPTTTLQRSRLAEEEEGTGRWVRLHSQLSDKLSTLQKIQEDHGEADSSEEKDPGSIETAEGIDFVALQELQTCVATLRQLRPRDRRRATGRSSEGGYNPLQEGELYSSLSGVVLSVDELTDRLLRPPGAISDHTQLRLLLLECLATEFVVLGDELGAARSPVSLALSAEDPGELQRLAVLDECLQMAQSILLCSHDRLRSRLGRTHDNQAGLAEQEGRTCVLEEVTCVSGPFHADILDAPSLECMLISQWRKWPEDTTDVQRVSHALLQGLGDLVELGKERVAQSQDCQADSRSQLQNLVCRHKKFFSILGSRLAFGQWLFQSRPQGALHDLKDAWLELERRAQSLQQQALEQRVILQKRLQDWSQWEVGCERVSRLLEELEVLLPGADSEEEEMEIQQQDRLEACQRVLDLLLESRPTLGWLLDVGKVLQAGGCSTQVSRTGGALELRWQGIRSRTQLESKRSRDVQENWARFQKDSASLIEWTETATLHLESLGSGLAQVAPADKELNPNQLIHLLDFSVELEARSAQRASAQRAGTSVLQLKEADCPVLRRSLAQLEHSWSGVSSTLPAAQEKLHQLLLDCWPPQELLVDLETWASQVEVRLQEEREGALKACSGDQLTQILQRYQELKAGMASGQLTLDFLCQSGPLAALSPAQHSERSERTLFAERLGDVSLRWLLLQRELDIQMREAERLMHACVDRETKLQRIRSWVELQSQRLGEWLQPVSQIQADKALAEWEPVEERVKELRAALQELSALRVCEDQQHPSDQAFSQQVEAADLACSALSQQGQSLKSALQHVLEEWGQFEQKLGEVSLLTTRVRCTLEYSRSPLFYSHQVKVDVEHLQMIQEDAGKGAEVLAAVDQLYSSLRILVSPDTAQLLSEKVEGERTRWKAVVQEVEEALRRTKELHLHWQEYSRHSDRCMTSLRHHQEHWEELLNFPPKPHDAQDRYTEEQIGSIKNLQADLETLQPNMCEVLEASKMLIGQLDPLAASLIQSETRLLSRDLLLLSQILLGKERLLQEDLDQRRMLLNHLEALEKDLENFLQRLNTDVCDGDSAKMAVCELSSLLPKLADLSGNGWCVSANQRQAERVQCLASQWKQAIQLVSAKHREIEDEVEESKSIQQKLHTWESFLDTLEESLAGNIASNYSGLLDMLAVHQRHQIEISTKHHIFRGLVYNTASSLVNSLPEERSKLIQGLSQLRERWKGIVGLFLRRGVQVQGLLGQWRLYRRGVRVLWRLMRDVDPLLPPAGLPTCSLHQLRRSLNNFEHIEETLRLHRSVQADTLEAGRRLSESLVEPQEREGLQRELQALEEAWLHTLGLLGKRRALVQSLLQTWERCEAGLADSAHKLRELQARQEQPLPERLEELERQEKILQETEASLEGWASGLRDIATMKTDLSQYVVAGDASLLQEQVEALHNQWEELCHKVSLRRQEIASRLSAWIIFNDKNQELSDWLAQMENKVSRSGDLSIEDMVEKLKKDCMEEIRLFSENQSHLQRLGEQLLSASDPARQAQLQGCLREAGERWQALFQHIEARVRKLKETLVTVQQLDKNMSNLRSWLGLVEAHLSRPVTYSVVHQEEIQRRLAEQQELQRDIEQHTEGVASVLTLCDVLLRDEDACGSDAESDSVQKTTRSLDQRWRSICALSLERRLRIEETWRLWCKFLDDYSRFDDWLKTAERTAANPRSSGVLYTVAKEELKKFEGFQRQVHERLTQLELVNNQYRRLARENRTDRASKLKVMVHEGNHRWDTLARRVAAILRRLKHFTGQREEFEATRESMLVWLTELDLQLTNVEHFSESDVHHKMQQLNSFQKDITLNTERIDGLIVCGEALIQRSAPLDAALIEDELEELHSYCQEVFSRVVRFHQRLSQPPTLTEEPDLFDSSTEGSCELIGRPWLGRGQGSAPVTPTHLLAPPLERSGRETPVSVDSLPLEWDHTGDVGGSSSHEEDEGDHEGEETYFSALSDVEVTESSEAFVEATGQALGPPDSVPGRPTGNPESAWSSGDQDRKSLYLDADDDLNSSAALTSTPFKQGYAQLMAECSGSLDSVKRVSLILDDEEQPDEQGLTSLTVADKQSGVIERWELLQAQARSEQQQGPQDPLQLTSDLCDITSWLGRVNPELDRLKRSDPSAGIQDLEARVKQLKEMQKDFTRYKAVMLSLNLGVRGPGGAQEERDAQQLQENLGSVNQGWTLACAGLGEWESSLRHTLMRSQEFHETLHSLLLWLAHAESRRYAVDIHHPDTLPRALSEHHSTLTALQEELHGRQTQVAALQGLWAELQPEEGGEESDEAREKLHVTANKLCLLLRQVGQDLDTLQQRMDSEGVSISHAEGGVSAQGGANRGSTEEDQSRRSLTETRREEKREPSPPRSFFYRVLRAAFPLHILLLLLLVLACLVPFTENDHSCTLANNFARSFYPMLRYTNGPPPT